VGFTRTIDNTPDLAYIEKILNKDLAAKAALYAGVTTFDESFSFLNGASHYTQTATPQTLKRFEGNDQLAFYPKYDAIYTADRVETLVVHASHDQRGQIADKQQLPVDTLIEVALGMRSFGGDRWLTATDINRFKASTDNNGNTVLTWVSPTQATHIWTFTVDPVPRLISYTLAGDGWFKREMTCDKFSVQKGVAVPTSVIWKEITNEGNTIQWTLETVTLAVTQVVVDDPANTPDKYVMHWPLGTRVLDGRVKQEIDITSTTRPLSDDDIVKVLAAKPKATTQSHD
jgi:hypothetical protein